jgi:hypothetical protein
MTCFPQVAVWYGKRMKVACRECRRAKRKCQIQTAQDCCLACQVRGQACSYGAVVREKPAIARKATQTQDFDLPLSSQADILGLYFHFIHDRPHSLFHRRTLEVQLEQQCLPEGLLWCLMAFGCRFSPDAAIRQLEIPFMEKAERVCLAELESPSLANIQALILLADLCGAHMKYNAEAVLFGMAPASMDLGSADPSNKVWRFVWHS